MTGPDAVTVVSRSPGPVAGYTSVYARVAAGETGTFIVADAMVGTDAELREIAAQSATRQELRRATRSGHD